MASKEHLKQIRHLSIALFLSGAANIIFTVLFFFWIFFYERPLTPYLEQKPLAQTDKLKSLVVSPSNADLLRRYKAKTYEQLIPMLSNLHLVEDGFTERDLALGVLVTFHDFDLERALGNQKYLSQKRMLSFDEGKEKVIVYPNLTKSQFDAILAFVRVEKWPFKPQGLFHLLKQNKQNQSLFDAFYLTPEFASFESLFKNQGIERETLAQVISEGSFGLLSAFNEKQKGTFDFSEESRQKLLLSYIKEGSRVAVQVLLKTDFDFASKRLSDPTVLQILEKITQNSPESEKFLSAIAGSPRGDSVKSLAIHRYQEVFGKSWEPLVSRKTVAVKPDIIEKAIVFQKKTPTPVQQPKAPVKIQTLPKKSLLYIVQDGDSLWKISKRFNVSIEEIRKVNVLKSDALKPGTPLKVPTSTR